MKNVKNYNFLRKGKTGLSYLILLTMVFFAACKKGFYNNKLEDKLTVFSEVTAGDSIMVSIGKSMLVGNGNIISFEKLTNAKVTIQPEDGLLRSLSANSSADFFNNPTAVYTLSDIAQYNRRYILDVSQPLLGNVSAQTIIPGNFNVIDVRSEEYDLNQQEVLLFNFTIDDPSKEKNYYIFEAVKQLVSVSNYFYWQGARYDYNTEEGKNLYSQVKDQPGVQLNRDTIPSNRYIRLSLFKNDNKTDNDQIGNLDSSLNRIFVTDSFFNGRQVPLHFAISQERFKASSPEERGVVLIQIKSVTRDLYDYLSVYEKYKSDFGTIPTGQLSSPQGNVQNGLGVFGGVSKKEWKFYYDDLE